MNTIIFALISVSLRAYTAVSDRHSYGFLNYPILLLNFVNSVLPFLLLATFLFYVGQSTDLFREIFSPGMLMFAVAVQLVSLAFTYSFSHFSVARVNIASRFGDILIPISLALYGKQVGVADYAFTLLISACSFVAMPKKIHNNGKSLFVPAALISSALVLQGLSAEVLFSGSGFSKSNVAACGALLFWRSAFSLILFLIHRYNPKSAPIVFHRGMLWGKKGGLLLLRAFATIGCQVSFIYALSSGNALVAWPILNSVSIFSIFIAAIFLKEKIHLKEFFAIVAVIIIISIKKLFIEGQL